jgi:large subunit ribosomal protein L9
MKVVILKTNEVKEVSSGYALNWLLPQKLAAVATPAKLEQLNKEAEVAKSAKNQEEMADKAAVNKFNGKTVVIKAEAGKAGKIHGSITKKEIALHLKILKTNIILEEPIKKIGSYPVGVKFGSSRGQITLQVEPK